MFAVVYSAPAVGPAIFDPEVGLDFALMVHGGQEFRWGPLVVAGDEITTADLGEGHLRARRATGFYVFETTSDEPGRRDGVRRHLDEHRAGGLRWPSSSRATRSRS